MPRGTSAQEERHARYSGARRETEDARERYVEEREGDRADTAKRRIRKRKLPRRAPTQ